MSVSSHLLMGDLSANPTQTTRLAPSPTGALHLGNARTFIVNWAMARQSGWRIVLRVEDLDSPRVKPGVIEQTIDTLSWLGLDWDEGPIIQSDDLSAYGAAMEQLASLKRVFPCDLTRSEIEAAASAPQQGVHETRFPPKLRPTDYPDQFFPRTKGWRFVVDPGEIEFEDTLLGKQSSDPSQTVGDFVVWTKRGQPAYQLAVVVDDADQGVTQIVRGDDLLDSSARQILLRRALCLSPEPTYTHLSMVVGEDGRRLAKRHGDTRLTHYRQQGAGPDRIVGLIGSWCGMGPPQPMSAKEFLRRFNLHNIPQEQVVFRPGDEQWILAN